MPVVVIPLKQRCEFGVQLPNTMRQRFNTQSQHSVR